MSKVRIFAKFAEIADLYNQAARSEHVAVTIDVGESYEGHITRNAVGVYIYGMDEEARKYPNQFKTDPLAAKHSRTGNFTPEPNRFENGGFKSTEQIVQERIVAAALCTKKFSPPKVSKKR